MIILTGWESCRLMRYPDELAVCGNGQPGVMLKAPGQAAAAKLEAAEQLADLGDQAGISLIELAIAFVLRHPAVTCAIIGPRTMEHLQSQFPAAKVTLTGDVLDRIDEIMAPGLTINPADGGWVSPALEPSARRR
jgi:diketogulonate reductase-like aldo/keto reductase